MTFDSISSRIGRLFGGKTAGTEKLEKKIDLSDQLKGFYGEHRSGWPYVLKILKQLHQPGGLRLDSFIERTFCWHPDGPRARKEPWIGFIHVPPNIPRWFQYQQSNDHIFQTEFWKESYPFCRGLFTLSMYHKKNLEKKLDVPIENLFFPTEIPALKWTPERFAANKEKKIVQVGWWLRKLHAIFLLPAKSYKKVFLRVTHANIDGLIAKEREILKSQGSFDEKIYDTAEPVKYLENSDYDRLLSENIAFVNLYNSSANNTVIECMARNTPLLVNPLESVKEYLGKKYPFYFNSLDEAAEKAENHDLVMKTHQYLLNLPQKKKLAEKYFLKSFMKSRIYKNIKL